MNQFITKFDAMKEHFNLSKEQEELIKHICSASEHTSLDEFCRTNISTDDAAGVAFAEPSVCNDYFENEGIAPELLIANFPSNDIAHYLAFEQPHSATDLLNELLYYRKVRRI